MPPHGLRVATARRDPRRHEFTILDLAVGWLVAALTVPVVAIVHEMALSTSTGGPASATGLIAVFAVLWGIPVLTVVGVPVAALAAFLLRRVPWEAVHLLAFALLGAAGFVVLAVVVSPYALLLAPYGIVAAVVGRWSGGRFAIARVDAMRARALARAPGMRDDAWLVDADGRDERLGDAGDARATRGRVDAGIPDPRRNEFGLVDVGVAWVAGTGTILTVAAATGGVLAVQGEPYWAAAAWYVATLGAIAMTIVGLPFGALLARALRRVAWEWVHLAAFGALGLAVTVVPALVLSGGATALPHPVLLATVLVALSARIAARLVAIARFDRDAHRATATARAWPPLRA
ncbi:MULTISPECIES: hypothetical protein [unclassified Agrococcus]|uniref:hypothetical protein n=1 Tax=unclassified Agrococcus TaxID=2615065 RepID=UPI00360EF6ED